TEIQRENGDPVQDPGVFADTGHRAAVLRVPGQEEAILYRAPDRRNALLVLRAAPDRCIHPDSPAAARAPGRVVRPPPGIVTADIVPTVIIQAVFAPYLFLMLRRVYRVSRWYAGLLAASIAWSFFHIVWLFRFLLFVVTLR